MDVRDSRGSLASAAVIHLPEASAEFASDVLDEIERMTDALPNIEGRVSPQLARTIDSAPDGADEFVCLMAVVETLDSVRTTDPTNPYLIAPLEAVQPTCRPRARSEVRAAEG